MFLNRSSFTRYCMLVPHSLLNHCKLTISSLIHYKAATFPLHCNQLVFFPGIKAYQSAPIIRVCCFGYHTSSKYEYVPCYCVSTITFFFVIAILPIHSFLSVIANTAKQCVAISSSITRIFAFSLFHLYPHSFLVFPLCYPHLCILHYSKSQKL